MKLRDWLHYWSGRERWTLAALSLSTVALCAASLTLALLMRSLMLSHTAMPYWDQFDAATPEQTLNTLFARHNEHLILLPRLGFLLDFSIAEGSNVLNIAVILLIQAAHALLLGWMVTAGNREWRRPDIVAFGFAFCACFSALQFENLAWGFQTQFVGVYALATACFAIAFLGGNGLGTALAASTVGAMAMLTMANGVIVLPIVAAITLLAGRPWQQVLFYALASILVAVIFFSGYVSVPGHGSPAAALREPWRVLVYVAVFLGGPVANVMRFAVNPDGNLLSLLLIGGPSVVIGGAGLLAAGLLGARALVKRRSLSAVEFALLGGIAFIVASATVTAMGRASFGYQQAASSRYGTPALLFWCLLFLWLQLLAHRRGGALILVASSSLTAAAVVLVLLQPRSLNSLEDFVAVRYTAEVSIISGVRDETAFLSVFPDPARVESQMRELREQRRSIFAPPYVEWMGRPLEEILRVLPGGRCLGRLDSATMQGSGSERFVAAAGWAWDQERRRPISRILLVNHEGRIVGFGRGPLRLKDIRARTQGAVGDTRVGWIGRAAASSGATLRAYGLAEADAVCALDGEGKLIE